MKKGLALSVTIMAVSLAVALGGCEKPQKHEKHLLGYPDSYDTTSAGASSYDGWCDDSESKYFKINDYYGMKSQGTLHILSNFEPYQQTKEYTCGAACSHMVINWFDKDLADKYDELTIADMAHIDTQKGVGPDGLDAFFNEIGWKTETNAKTDKYFESPGDFEKYVIEKIDAGIPIMVDWIDWSGHWEVIIGIDTCKADNNSDDVLIFADPYDTSDQWQDGYYTFSAERFFGMWTEGRCTGKQPEDIFIQSFVVASPK